MRLHRPCTVPHQAPHGHSTNPGNVSLSVPFTTPCGDLVGVRGAHVDPVLLRTARGIRPNHTGLDSSGAAPLVVSHDLHAAFPSSTSCSAWIAFADHSHGCRQQKL